MSWQAALSLGIPALVAVAGFLVAYRNSLRLSERRDRLDRITRQLGDFYGPLFATASAGNAAWAVFRSLHRPGGAFWDKPGPPPTDDETAAWRRWMTTVFMPMNRRLRDTIVDHADLLDEDHVPQLLLDVCAHVASYEAVLQQWSEGDYTAHTSPLNFPADELLAYADAAVRRLKSEQQKLLRGAVRASTL
jgi:hypothetical protein